MPIDRPTLEAAIKASGGAEQPADQLDGLLAKLLALEATGRYGALLKGLAASNDKSNFLAQLLESTFAHQFEAVGMPLDYEVKQVADQTSSIDFMLKANTGDAVYFELRLLQQGKAVADDIAKQLADGNTYVAAMNGEDEQDEILRLQNIVLSKVESKGKPIKFVRTGDGVVNIVVVCISDILLGTPDVQDCLLATYGDPEVPAECRRDVFGLFQSLTAEYPEHIQKAAANFAHIKATVHAVLFLFKPQGAGVLDYSLQQVLVWNRSLTTNVQALPLAEQFAKALPVLEASQK